MIYPNGLTGIEVTCGEVPLLFGDLLKRTSNPYILLSCPRSPHSTRSSAPSEGVNNSSAIDGGGGGSRRRRSSRGSGDTAEPDYWKWFCARGGPPATSDGSVGGGDGGGGRDGGGGGGGGGVGGGVNRCGHAEVERRAEDWAGAFAERGVEVSHDGVEENEPKSTAKKPFLAASQTHEWKTFEGCFQRLGFACTLGLAALVLTIILWTVSMPWVAWCLLRCVRPAVSTFQVALAIPSHLAVPVGWFLLDCPSDFHFKLDGNTQVSG